MNKLLILFFAIFISIGVKSQEDTEKIRWEKSKPLSWENFKAEPDSSSEFYAMTNSGITFGWNYSTKTGIAELTHEVFAKFAPHKSWVKKEFADENLLAHEQLHFDITELYARMLRKSISEYTPGENIREDLRQIYEKNGEERNTMQARFDEETDHGNNSNAELTWRKIVEIELERFEEFAL